MDSIYTILNKLNTLPAEQKELVARIFDISAVKGQIVIPQSFRKKVREFFSQRDQQGNFLETEEEVIKKIETQTIIKITNKLTGEGSLFNWLRSFRPGIPQKDKEKEKRLLQDLIESSKENCNFCQPEKYTPEDIFGRIIGKHCITASNVAKYDAWHGLVIGKNHNPLEFNEEEFSDYITTSLKWFKKAHSQDPKFDTPYLLWNCLPRSGSSQAHNHLQIVLSRGYLAKISLLKERILEYQNKYKSNYFEDFYKIHELLGLGLSKESVKICAHLTPIKTREMVLISAQLDNSAIKILYKIIRHFINRLDMTNFNLAISFPTYGDSSLPYIARLVDRGSIIYTSSDIGAPELYAQNVTSVDPYDIIKSFASAGL